MFPALGVLLRGILSRVGTRLLGRTLAKQGTKIAASRVINREATASLTRRAIERAPKAQRVHPRLPERGKGLSLDTIKRMLSATKGEAPQKAPRWSGAPAPEQPKRLSDAELLARINKPLPKDFTPWRKEPGRAMPAQAHPKPQAPQATAPQKPPQSQAAPTAAKTVQPSAKPANGQSHQVVQPKTTAPQKPAEQPQAQTPVHIHAPQQGQPAQPLPKAPGPPQPPAHGKAPVPQPGAPPIPSSTLQKPPAPPPPPGSTKPATTVSGPPPLPSSTLQKPPAAPAPNQGAGQTAPPSAAPPSSSSMGSAPTPPAPDQGAAPKAPPSSMLQRIGSLFKGGDAGEPKRPSLFDSAKNLYNYATGRQQQSGPPDEAPRERRDFSSLAAKGSNFGDLLSGKKTHEDVVNEANQGDKEEQRKEHQAQSDEARKQAVDSLKHITKAAAVGGVALLTIPPAMKKFSEAMLAGQEHLKRYNGAIAGAFARLTRADIQRARQTGSATAGTTTALAEAVSHMRDDIRPLKDTAINIGNTLAIGFAKTVGFMAKMLRPIEWIARAFGFNGPAIPQMGPWQAFLNDRAKEYRQRAQQTRGFRPIPPQPQGPGGGAQGGQGMGMQ